jgi:hypothetical protein
MIRISTAKLDYGIIDMPPVNPAVQVRGQIIVDV